MRGGKQGGNKGEDPYQKREQGFNNYYSGANQDRAAEKDKELKERSKSKTRVYSKERRGWNDKPVSGTQKYLQEAVQYPPRTSTDRYSTPAEEDTEENHDYKQLSAPNPWAMRRAENVPVKQQSVTPTPNNQDKQISSKTKDHSPSKYNPGGLPHIQRQVPNITQDFDNDVNSRKEFVNISDSIKNLNGQEIDLLRESFYGEVKRAPSSENPPFNGQLGSEVEIVYLRIR